MRSSDNSIVLNNQNNIELFCKTNGLENQLPLFTLFYGYFIKKNDHPHSLNHAKTLCHFLASHPQLSMITTSYNLTDGMGDFISHLFYIIELEKVYHENTNVNLQHFCFVEPGQMKSVESMLADRMGKSLFTTIAINDPHPLNEINKKIIVIEYKKEEKTLKMLINPEIKNYLKSKFHSSQFTFNFSLSLSHIMSLIDDKSIIKNNYLQTWFEYGISNMSNYKEAKHTMGISKDEIGLRVFNDVVTLAQKTLLEKIKTLHAIKQNREILKIFTNKTDPTLEDIRQWAENNTLIFAYAKKMDTTLQAFQLLAASTRPTGNTYIIMDTNLIQHSSRYWGMFDDFQYTHVEWFDELGDTVSHKLQIDNRNEERRLIIVPLKGIKDEVKKILMSLSEINLASGDTSMSEMISSGYSLDQMPALPFIQPLHFKMSFYGSIIAQARFYFGQNIELQKEGNSLIQYLSSIIHCTYNDENMLDWVNKVNTNRTNILTAWKKLCQFIVEEKNIEINFQEQLILNVFLSLVQNGKIDDCVNLVCQLDQMIFHEKSFLHIALFLNKKEFFEKIFKDVTVLSKIKKYLTVPLINSMIDEAFNYQPKLSNDADYFTITLVLVDYLKELKYTLNEDQLVYFCEIMLYPNLQSEIALSTITNDSSYAKELLLYSIRLYAKDNFAIIVKSMNPIDVHTYIFAVVDTMMNVCRSGHEYYLSLLLEKIPDEKEKAALFDKILELYACKNYLHLVESSTVNNFSKDIAQSQYYIISGTLEYLKMKELGFYPPDYSKQIVSILKLFDTNILLSQSVSFISQIINSCHIFISENKKVFLHHANTLRNLLIQIMLLTFRHGNNIDKVKDDIHLHFKSFFLKNKDKELMTLISPLSEKIIALSTLNDDQVKQLDFDRKCSDISRQLSLYLGTNLSDSISASQNSPSIKFFADTPLDKSQITSVKTLIEGLKTCKNAEQALGLLRPFTNVNGIKDPELSNLLSTSADIIASTSKATTKHQL